MQKPSRTEKNCQVIGSKSKNLPESKIFAKILAAPLVSCRRKRIRHRWSFSRLLVGGFGRLLVGGEFGYLLAGGEVCQGVLGGLAAHDGGDIAHHAQKR